MLVKATRSAADAVLPDGGGATRYGVTSCPPDFGDGVERISNVDWCRPSEIELDLPVIASSFRVPPCCCRFRWDWFRSIGWIGYQAWTQELPVPYIIATVTVYQVRSSIASSRNDCCTSVPTFRLHVLRDNFVPRFHWFERAR